MTGRSPEARFIMGGGNHRMGGSAYPFNICGHGWEIHAPALEQLPLKGDTVTGNDVWIGRRATMMPGVTIGRRDHRRGSGRRPGCGALYDSRRQSCPGDTEALLARDDCRAA
ncbi:hypothetical protein [Paenibacillus thiaminolyticus]|uniref:hypothetical protein n=1 Tax=Paenibacillus thiaminolyticus TaxID=49283 RepID=UPI003D2DF85F